MSTTVDPVNEVEPTPAKASLWEDFVDIFYAPSSVFARRAEGKFGAPLAILIVVSTILVYLTINAMQPVMDAEFARHSADMLAKNPNMTQEQLSAGRKFFENFGPIFFAFGILIGVIGTGIVIWLVGKLFDAKESVSAAIMDFVRLEAGLLYSLPKNLGFTAGVGHVLSGRNVGQSTTFRTGLFYALHL